jgi:hypothetical protein
VVQQLERAHTAADRNTGFLQAHQRGAGGGEVVSGEQVRAEGLLVSGGHSAAAAAAVVAVVVATIVVTAAAAAACYSRGNAFARRGGGRTPCRCRWAVNPGWCNNKSAVRRPAGTSAQCGGYVWRWRA